MVLLFNVMVMVSVLGRPLSNCHLKSYFTRLATHWTMQAIVGRKMASKMSSASAETLVPRPTTSEQEVGFDGGVIDLHLL